LTYETPEKRDILIIGLEFWAKDSKGDLLRIFFLEKYLQDFLENINLSEIGGIRKHFYDNKKETDYLKYNKS
jgi:hypothetical protein